MSKLAEVWGPHHICNWEEQGDEGQRRVHELRTVIGILMLDTAFPRIPGDIGNALTYGFPVRYKIVRAHNRSGLWYIRPKNTSWIRSFRRRKDWK